MDPDDVDREQIDRLVQELIKTQPLPAATPAAGQTIAGPEPAWPPGAPSGQAEPRLVNRWTNVRLLMPPARTPGTAKHLALVPIISLSQVPDLNRYLRMPAPIVMTRMWVGLGAVYSASMAFWPYPKTYLWGLLLYLFCLGLVLVSGVWGARLSWEARLGASHTIALGSVVWAVTLVAAETLPLR
jgi:hypothetical protein